MNLSLTKKMAIAGAMSAISIILDFISIRTDLSKFTIYGLPLLLTGILFGPIIGLLAGVVVGFITQMITYGPTLTTPIWMLAPIAWGLISGLLSKSLIKDKINLAKTIIVVLITSLSALLLNTLAMYLDGLILDYPTEYIWTTIGLRVLISFALSIPYCFITYFTVPRLKHLHK